MAHDHHPYPLFDPDDLDDFDFMFVNQWWHAVLAILSMGPAYLLLFAIGPIILGLGIIGLGYWTGRETYRILRWLSLAMLQALGIILHALRDVLRLVQR
jgi:hypothetical protein